MRVKDLPERDRPRERMLARGPEALADRELVALLIGSGAPGVDAIELASQLITKHGSLYELSKADPHELAGLPGMGPAKAARVIAAFHLGRRARPDTGRQRVTSSADLATVTAPLVRGLRRERVVVVICNSSGTVLRITPLTEGSADRSLLSIRDVLGLVLAAGGAAFGIVHNHPSGNPEPSKADHVVTARLREGAEAVGLRFMDHLVVTDTEWRRITAPR